VRIDRDVAFCSGCEIVNKSGHLQKTIEYFCVLKKYEIMDTFGYFCLKILPYKNHTFKICQPLTLLVVKKIQK
jgi:hypothetical protein